MLADIVRKGDSSNRNQIEVVGGKGHNLLRLSELSEGQDYSVPDFYIIPVNSTYSREQLNELFALLNSPLAVRSSSPLEDSRGYSFAGRFKSLLGIGNLDSFERAIGVVVESARDSRVTDYAQQHGLTIDDRMAVIVQEMVDPLYSGVCYSTSNPNNPRTIVEFISGLSDELMSGNKQGSIASFDNDFQLTMEHGNRMPDLERVARVAKNLEGIFGERLDVEFVVSKDRQIYVVQARPITDPVWPYVELPEVDDSRLLLEADIVRGSGIFTGPVFVFRGPTEMQRYCRIQNKQPMTETHEQWNNLRAFNRKHTGGYCLIADNLEAHEMIMEGGGLSNLSALVTVDHASRFSHPVKVVSETGAFYLGSLGRKDILDSVDTGDILSVSADQSRGLIYDLIKPEVKYEKANLDGVPVVSYETARGMQSPDYEDIDGHLFPDQTGKVGILFIDYNDENGMPYDVLYSLVVDGLSVGCGRYQASRAIFKHLTFPSLLDGLLAEARTKLPEK